jgi:peptidoglycan hydrolase-like protein with peptidoglycan-binding domain
MRKKQSLKIMKDINNLFLGRMKSGKLSASGKWFNVIWTLTLVLFFSAAGFFIIEASFAPLGAVAGLYDRATRIIGLNVSAPINSHPNSVLNIPYFFPGQDEEKPVLPPVIKRFLKSYSLSNFDKAFFDAIRFVQFRRVAGDIYRSSGYELIRLDIIPESIRKKYEVLSYPLGPNGKLAHFLFWRPPFRIDKFYYSYKGHDIFLLQKKMTAINLYDGPINGVVGPDLLYAIVQFQQQMGMEITGFPDDKTVFLACQLASRSESSFKDDPAALR